MGGTVRIAYWLGAVILTLVVGWGILADRRALVAQVQQAQEATRTAVERAERAERATVLRAKLGAATARQQARTGTSLAAAVASSPAWAEQPVPQEVQNALAE